MRQIRHLAKCLVLTAVVFALGTSCQLDGSKPSEKGSPYNNFFPAARALMASRFPTLSELQDDLTIHYVNPKLNTDSTPDKGQSVVLIYVDHADTIVSVLDYGVTQGDMIKVRDGSFAKKVSFAFQQPYSLANRVELNKIYKLARRRPRLFGEGDVAFYDLALACVNNIMKHKDVYRSDRDSSEKGFINTYNHITAQALITSLYGTRVADFIADLHERHAMPHLLTGMFNDDELTNPDKNALDNYVDLINNTLGQEIGLVLRKKYKISNSTIWTSDLLANYLNDLQSYFSFSFGVGHKPFSPDSKLLLQMANKINRVQDGVPYGIE